VTSRDTNPRGGRPGGGKSSDGKPGGGQSRARHPNAGEITDLLQRRGDEGAEDRLVELLYPSLRAIAANRLSVSDRGVTLDTRDLVHEAYLRMLSQKTPWENRAHFLAVCARVMRRVIIDRIRHRGRSKRGADVVQVPLDDEIARSVADGDGQTPFDWLELDAALRELAEIDPRAEKVVELRYFSGMTLAEVATALETSSSTVERTWRFARAWLERRLGGESEGSENP